MQRVRYLIERQDGFVVLSLLILVVFLSVLAQGIIHMVKQQAKTQQEYIRHRQIAALGTGLILAVRTQENQSDLQSQALQEIVFYPGAEKIVPQLAIERRETVPLQAVKVLIKYKEATWKMQYLKLEPPGGALHNIYNNIVYSDEKIEGKLPEGLLPNNYPLAVIRPKIDISGYLKYKSNPLPDASTLQELGLLSRLYANNSGGSGAYSIKKNTIIRGNGILYHNNPIKISEGCSSNEKLWIISNDEIIIEDNVNLGQVFLYANGPISIGRNVTICGIIIGAGKIQVGEGFAMRGDKSVLETFLTACYMN
jgi:hypothetical protein